MEKMSVGQYIRKVYMEQLKISNSDLAKALNVNPSTLTRLLSGKASCSVDMAVRLSVVFTTSPERWLNLQRTYDLQNVEVDKSKLKVLWRGEKEFGNTN
ncbi:hypothetical protein NVP1101O_134 [Vibrio phage 1.101.O._10N.261.45.C6]|nr:hypothetical protein NVP1101O_134 [Vibrio phage 1.101.O._10N.261.45.C6]